MRNNIATTLSEFLSLNESDVRAPYKELIPLKISEMIKENVSNITPAQNRKILRDYIKVLKTYNGTDIDCNNDVWIKYLTIIHNFLHIEEKNADIVRLSGKELNNKLSLSKTSDYTEIVNRCKSMYDNNSAIRYVIETFDSIEEVRLFMRNISGLYDKLIFKL